MRLARDVRAFLFALVCGRHENGVGEISNFLGFLGIVGWDERERKIFGFLGNLSFLGFKRDGDHYLFFFKCNIY